MEKCFEDARQDEKHILDLLEAIMRPTDPVKEKLRQKLFRTTQFGSKITKMRVSKFWISGIQNFETPIFLIVDSDWVILNNFCRNSSFTRPGSCIIDSSRSGTCFSSCLTSSIYFSIRKKCLFLKILCPDPQRPSPSNSFLEYRKSISLRMADRYTRIFDAG